MQPKISELAYWINEREQMRLAKNEGRRKKHGYSNDHLMGTVRYCNVHREDDTVTQWLAHHWRPKYHQAHHLALARMLNYIPTLNAVLEDMPDMSAVSEKLKDLRTRGKIFTGAYTVSTAGNSMDKVDYVMRVVYGIRGQEYRLEALPLKLADWHKVLTEMGGLGSFLAAQVIADMKNTKEHPLCNRRMEVFGWWTWAAPGPGSIRGLSVFWGRHVMPSTFKNDLQECWELVRHELDQNVFPMHMQDFQNCLCEFSKYMRVKGGGRARNRYSPG